MLAAIAEFEHDLIVERTHEGLAAAVRAGGERQRAQDDTGQNCPAQQNVRRADIHRRADRQRAGVTRATIYRHLQKQNEQAP